VNACVPLRRWTLALACLVTGPAWSTTFSVLNMDTGTTGLNDTTAFTPVGGNTAATLGQARLNVIAEAGRQWGLRVSSPQTIVIEAKMVTDTCTASSGTLASAGPRTYFTTSAEPNVLVPAALAHALHGPDANNRSDISLSINSAVGSGSGCLNGRGFYLGFDHTPGTNIDLLNVLLHELGHGLGFVSLTDQTGAPLIAGKFSSFDQRVYSESLGKYWPSMTDAERASASVANGTLVFNGASVNTHLSAMIAGLSNPGAHLRLYAPSTWSDGSSVSHWDTVASPNLLMEPFITSNPQGLTDVTGCVLVDIGWPSARCADSATAANTPPVAVAQTVSVAGDTPTAITLRGTDPDSTTLTYSIVSPPARGTLTAPASLTGASGVVYSYTAGTNQTLTDSFTFQVSDGTSTSSTATVTLNVTAINHAPVANPQTLNLSAGQAIAITLSGSDADGNALSYSLVAGSGPVSGTLTGTPPNVSYTPNAGFIGNDSFQFRVNDGQLNSVPATVSLDVVAAPAAVATGGGNSGGGGGGGGGAIDDVGLFILALLLIQSGARASGMRRVGAHRPGAR
jgi:hypothetical protein